LRQAELPKSAGVAGLLAMTVPRYFSDRLLWREAVSRRDDHFRKVPIASF